MLESLSMNGQDVVAVGAATRSDPVYFPTARGQQSVEYLLMICRAHLLAGARVVEVEWECPFPKLVYSAMSCRMSAMIEDPRLPGASVLGKVVEYSFSGDGDDGEFVGAVTINCAVGNGSPILLRERAEIGTRAVTSEGTPVYVEVGYVELGYQHYEGRMITAATGDTSFEELAFEAVGIQLPVTQDQILVRHEYHDAGLATPSSSVAEILRTGAAQLRNFPKPEPIGQPIESPPPALLAYSRMEVELNNALSVAMTENPSWVEMEFKPVQRIATSLNYTAGVTPLVIPKQIDLGAS